MSTVGTQAGERPGPDGSLWGCPPPGGRFGADGPHGRDAPRKRGLRPAPAEADGPVIPSLYSFNLVETTRCEVRGMGDVVGPDAAGPAPGVLAKHLDALLAAATRAPSVHNTQPWRFR